MIIIKKSSRFIALLLVALTFNVYSMKRLREEEKRSIPAGLRILLPTGRWVEIVGEILLNEAHIQDLVQFTDLPPEVLERIIYLLSANEAAQSLEDVAKNINTLALVTKDLNALINHPSFCLHLIKHLSQKFNCSNEKAAKALQTQEAQQRLALQKNFYNALAEDINMQDLEQFWLQGIDINFTYDNPYNEALYVAYSNQEASVFVEILQWFITKGLNKDQQNLLLVHMIEALYQDVDLSEDQLDIIKILLDASADPEIIGRGGNSMLLLMQELLDAWQKDYDEIIREEEYGAPEYLEDINDLKRIIIMLKDAIQRKHGRK